MPVTVTLSIDLDTPDSQQTEQVARFADNLFSILDRARMPATWSVVEPANCPLVARVGGRQTLQEFAVLVDHNWSPEHLGRTEFALRLRDRVEAAQQSGLRLHALTLERGVIDEHFDLLVKHRISVVRGGEASADRIDLRSARFGVWHAPEGVSLPGGQPWWLGGAKSTLRRAVSRAPENSVIHVTIDAPAVVAREQYGAIGEAIRWLETSTRSGSAKIRSLSDLARAAQQTRTRRPSQSILRAA